MRLRKKQGLRIVSSVLAASMVLSAFPTAAFAVDTDGTSNAGNSAVVETQAEESQDASTVGEADTLLTLKFNSNGIPVGGGSESEGWTYQADSLNEMQLTIYKGYTFDRNIVVKCNVMNWGTINAGTFEKYVYNGGEPNSRGVGKIEGNVTIHSMQNYGMIDGGTYDWVSNSGSIKNADIGVLHVAEDSTVENCVFGLANQEVPKNVHTLTFSVDAKINDVITTRYQNNNLTENYRVVCVAGNREVTVVYDDDEDNFVSWKADPEVNWTESDDKKTVTFTPDKDMTMTINETVMPLEFDADGKPTKKGNKTSKWEYNGYTLTLTLYEGYEFNQDVEVNCLVDNYGTITAGTFKKHVYNAGKITNGLFAGGVSNYIDTYSSADGDKRIEGTITGGVFSDIGTQDGNKPENTYKLTVRNSTINDEISMGAYIVGDNQKIKVTRDADDEDFESWKEVDGITISDPTAKTIEFTMPAKNITLEINYKDNILEFDADGNPTHAGGKNWERIWTGGEYGLILKEGAVLDTDGTVKCQIVAYPGSIIRNGVFEYEGNGYWVMNFGTIENGTFNGNVATAGTILDGNFNALVSNANVTFDSEQNLSILGDGLDAVVKDCPGLISGGTFNGAVVNAGMIKGGEFKETVTNKPLKEFVGGALDEMGITYTNTTEISDGTFWAEVQNYAEITGGDFKKKVTNVGEIDDGVFENEVKNTTSQKLSEGESQSETVAMAMTEADNSEIEMQNGTGSEPKYVGIIKGGIFTAESTVSNESTIVDGSFAGTVENASDGEITGGSFTGAVASEGIIANGSFTGEVKNTGNGQITGGDFTGKVENNSSKLITGGTFVQAPVNTIEEINLVTLTVPADCTVNGKALTTLTVKKGSSVEVKYNGTLTSWKWGGVMLENAAANPVTITMDSDVTLTVEEIKQEQPGETEKPDSGKTDTPSTEKPDSDKTDTPSTDKTDSDKTDTPSTEKPDSGSTDTPSTDKPDSGKTDTPSTEKPDSGKTDTPSTDKPDSGKTDTPSADKTDTDKPNTENPANNDSGAGALVVGGILVAGGVATGVIAYNVAMDYIKSALPEGVEIPETREQLAVALWENAGKPEVAVAEGVVLTDTEKAVRWAVEKQLISAEGGETVSKLDVLKAVYQAKKL